MSLTKAAAEKQNVCVDHPDALKLVKDGIASLLRTAAKKKLKMPWRFSMHDAHGDLLRSFRIHADGIELGPRTGPERAYVFPLQAHIKAEDGARLSVRLVASGVGKVEFLN